MLGVSFIEQGSPEWVMMRRRVTATTLYDAAGLGGPRGFETFWNTIFGAPRDAIPRDFRQLLGRVWMPEPGRGSDTVATRYGHAMEAVAADVLTDFGIPVQLRGQTVVSPPGEEDWFMVSPDGYTQHENDYWLVEIKCPYSRWKGVPVAKPKFDHWLQVQVQLAACQPWATAALLVYFVPPLVNEAGCIVAWKITRVPEIAREVLPRARVFARGSVRPTYQRASNLSDRLRKLVPGSYTLYRNLRLGSTALGDTTTRRLVEVALRLKHDDLQASYPSLQGAQAAEAADEDAEQGSEGGDE